MTVITKIPGYDLASELFKGVVNKNVLVPTDTVWGESWYNFLQHREIALRNYIRKESQKKHLGYENWPEQMHDYIQSELAEIAHLNLAVNGYPFKLGNLSFLSDSKEQDGYRWPVFVPLDVASANFQIKVHSYDSKVEITPHSLHPEIREHYELSVENLRRIRRRSSESSVSISFTNKTSPPDWARDAINQAMSSGLFSHVYILIDHSTIPWQVTNGDIVLDIKEQNRRASVDPMVIGYNSYRKVVDGFGSFSVGSWAVIALYDPSKHEQYVYDQFALPPRNF